MCFDKSKYKKAVSKGSFFYQDNMNRTKKNWGVKMIGFGFYLPGEPITNEQLKERLQLHNFNPQRHEEITGIKQRHWAEAGVNLSDIAAAAGRQALESAGIQSSQLDRIILATQTADYINVGASLIVQQLLGATCPVQDITTSCSGFLYALDEGIRMIATGMNYVLVIGADVKSRQVRKSDNVFLPIFSDGAGAVVLTACNENEGFLDIHLWADGSAIKQLYVPAGGSAMPSSHQTIDNDLHGTLMTVEGKQFASWAAHKMADMTRDICLRNDINIDEIDVFIPHQANLFIMKKTAALLNLPLEKMEVSINRAGNCIAGTVPLTLHQAYENGKLNSGKNIVLVSAGAGLMAGVALYKVPS